MSWDCHQSDDGKPLVIGCSSSGGFFNAQRWWSVVLIIPAKWSQQYSLQLIATLFVARLWKLGIAGDLAHDVVCELDERKNGMKSSVLRSSKAFPTSLLCVQELQFCGCRRSCPIVLMCCRSRNLSLAECSFLLEVPQAVRRQQWMWMWMWMRSSSCR